MKRAFKKLFGDGFLFWAIAQKTNAFFDILISPFEDIFNYFKGLKSVHFPFNVLDENNIINSERMFNLEAAEELSKRGEAASAQWSLLSGSQTFLQLQNILRRLGFFIQVEEGSDCDLYGARTIGNGALKTQNGEVDPIEVKTGKQVFIVRALEFFNEKNIKGLIEAIVKNKPLHNGAYFIPRFLRKKEIHGVMTKNQMQRIKKRFYCDVRG